MKDIYLDKKNYDKILKSIVKMRGLSNVSYYTCYNNYYDQDTKAYDKLAVELKISISGSLVEITTTLTNYTTNIEYYKDIEVCSVHSEKMINWKEVQDNMNKARREYESEANENE